MNGKNLMTADPIKDFVDKRSVDELITWLSLAVDHSLARTERMFDGMEDSFILGSLVSDQKTLQAILHALRDKITRDKEGMVNIPVV